MNPIARAMATLEDNTPTIGRHLRDGNQLAHKNGTMDRIHAPSKTSRFPVEYASSVEPKRMRIPAIVTASESRRGSNKIAPRVRQEKSSINVSYRDSLLGARQTRAALAMMDRSAP